MAKPHLNINNFMNRYSPLHIVYDTLSVESKISAIWLVEKACIFLVFLFARVQTECETINVSYKTFKFILT